MAIRSRVNLKLGIVWKDGRIINHRSLLKVLLNPICRIFGFCVATDFDDKTQSLGGLRLIFHRPMFKLWEGYNIEYDYIEKRRLLF